MTHIRAKRSHPITAIGSETAMKAAETARTIALATGSPLHIVAAFDSDRTEVFGSGSHTYIISEADVAEQIAKEVSARPAGQEMTISYSAARGKPAETLINEAERHQASMIVVGNRGIRGLGVVPGRVATNVSRNVPCDVLIAKTVTD